MKVQCAKPKVQIQLVKSNTTDNWLGQPVNLNQNKQPKANMRYAKSGRSENQVMLNFDC